jgi:GTPase SAR1 family protein
MTPPLNQGFRVSILALGKIDSGKTSLMLRHVHDIFGGPNYTDGIPDSSKTYFVPIKPSKVPISRDGTQLCQLMTRDARSLERFNHRSSGYYNSAQVFLMCYAVDSRESFDDLRTRWLPWKESFQESRTNVKKFIIVATKCDLPSSAWTVSSFEGRRLAAELQCHFFETSAKENYQIEELWSHAATLAVDAYEMSTLTDTKPYYAEPVPVESLWDQAKLLLISKIKN